MSFFLLLSSCSIERSPFIGGDGTVYVAGAEQQTNSSQEDTSESSEENEDEDSAVENTEGAEDTSASEELTP